MSEPKALSGRFQLRVDQSPAPGMPFMGNLGVYEILPDAIINIAFSGDVSLPPGTWEVGLVQNVWNDRVTIVYSEGGEYFFSQDTEPLLDVTDIWLNTLGTGVVTLDNPTGADKRFHIALDAGDTPTSPPIPGLMTRCNGTIREQLVFAERVLQLIAAVVARKDGDLFPIAATAGDTYGFMWRLDPVPGAKPSFRFRPLFPSAVEMKPPFSLFGPNGVTTTGPTGNEFGLALAARASAAYLADCERRAPREGDENLWP
jgi:hypothetical protein